MSERLFEGFSTVTAEEWREKILKDLKGKPYESLLKENFEGIAIKPDYTIDDISSNEETPLNHSFSGENNQWLVNQCFEGADAKATNAKILDALNRGVTSITLNNAGSTDLAQLLNEVLPQYIATYLNPDKDHDTQLQRFIELVNSNNWPVDQIAGGVLYDPLGHVLTTGNWYTSEEEDLTALAGIAQKAKALTQFKSIAVNGQYFHNAGASATQELGFALAQAHEYLVLLLEKGFSLDEAAATVWFSMASGTQYFMDIAKLRAARVLWNKIVVSYNGQSADLHLHVESSNWYNAIYDAHTNMLRATSEAMAGAIGGCNSMTVLPFDHAYQEANDFSYRIARNVQLVLQEESYLNKIVDPSSGSYYIEYLTDQVAKEAWKVFQSIEVEGGFLAAIKNGFIQQAIEKMAKAKDEKVASGELVILGVNKYPNAEEKMQDKVDMNRVESTLNHETAIAPIRLYRAAAAMEKERLTAETNA